MHVAAIIAAGGRGERIGGDRPKQFRDLGDGTMMLTRALRAIVACALVDEVIVALPAGGWHGDAIETGAKPLSWVAGGARRQDSVANAMARVSDAADLIVIHDAARPFVTPDLVERTIRAAAVHGAAIAAVLVTDTVKQAAAPGADGSRVIRATLPRETIFLAQTPQAFRRDVLAHAMAAGAEAVVTDEAMLVERLGFAVHIVEGDPRNIKVTTAHDLLAAQGVVIAQSRLQEERSTPAPSVRSLRIGTGYDLHRLVRGRPLILGGVRIPFERGLDGHSDADLVCHAVTDAILGGACAGDIGRLFPDTDPEWKHADSVTLLRSAADHIRKSGFTVVNVDVTVIAEQPRLLPHLGAMRANLAGALGIEAAAVSIKGKTNEGVDAIGRGEAMACHAVALLLRAL